ncbi:heterokaryon incompatibility protein-domain-containing protein [Xylaria bambusicola]|uniref:heterokaryon incompatibility protein-domain-containing protein n=1 Tax=Xylaria bambusicola TaxID=326684 RepID=UPI00200726A4|nr:heterokaryon incompatibility protein-domain-containing protein [Xylaria bambusicola]KAI0514662.1 heterokaryon incompatibility protein-domain-containing protein [Xylaria bambusicola]
MSSALFPGLLTPFQPDRGEDTLCIFCEQLVTNWNSEPFHVDHHPSLLSLMNSAGHCSLCRLLLKWINNKATHLEREALERSKQDTKIYVIEAGELVNKSTVKRRVFCVDTPDDKFPSLSIPKKQVATQAIPADVSISIHLLMVKEDKDSRSLVRRPIWSSMNHLSLEIRIATGHEWLRQCEAEHIECRAQRFFSQHQALPARMVDVKPNGNMDHVAIIDPYVLGDSFKYLALSHCWGKNGSPTRTTKDNLTEHEKGLRIEFLSRSFRDAVRITRLLGYKFLWIDSLCIVQDDIDDWEREAAKMASIFHCADIVISAASAGSSADGLGIDNSFQGASRLFSPPVPNSRYDNPAQTQGLPRKRLFFRKAGTSNKGLKDLPIHKRGWIFQEILLARRSEDGELSRTLTSSIIRGSSTQPSNPFLHFESAIQYETSTDVDMWWSILRAFFQRQFTKSDDVLPSLAGVISLWQWHTNDEPILGMWKKDLPFHMCWFFGNSLSVVDRVPGQPSWSWTSVPQGQKIDINHVSFIQDLSEHVIWQASIEAVDIKWVALPFVSPLRHASLSLRRVQVTKGNFYQAMTYRLDNKEENNFYKQGDLEILPLFIAIPHYTQKIDDGRFHMCSLLLEHIDLGDGQTRYRRKGYAEFLSWPKYSESEIHERAAEIISSIKETDVVALV